MAIVYTHRKPNNGEIFYVGIASDVRPRRPFVATQRNKWWLNTYNKYGFDVDIVADDITWEEAIRAEMFLINMIGRKDLGRGTLVNLTDGGEGVLGSKHSPKSIAKMKEIKKDSRLSKEALIKSVELRRKNGIQVIEVTTNKVYYLWNIHDTLGIFINVVRDSYENNKPISKGKFKGMLFKKIRYENKR